MPQFRKLLTAVAVGLSLGAGAGPLWPAAARAQEAPEKTVKGLKVAEGLEATLWASEPMVVNPTNIDIDARGRIWVTEAANYRRFITRPEGDRILILEDTDHDGKADKVTVFYQDKTLLAPLGIAVLGDKVYVAQSPNVLVFTMDESGDKPKGPPEVLFTGFGGTNHDHGVHSGVFGPDGRYYFNAGNEGGNGFVHTGKMGSDGKVTQGDPIVDSTGSEVGSNAKIYRGKPKAKGQPGYMEGYAFRCDPDGKNFETLGYNFRNNFELTVDSFGTVWQSDNDDDGNQGVRINYVMEGGNFGYKGPTGNDWNRDKSKFSDQTKQEAHWHQRWPGVVPNLLNTGGGSPTGITIYEGDLLPKQFQGALLHCDAGPNVVRAYMTSPSGSAPTGLMKLGQELDGATDKGAGYKALPIELVKAEDKWFRPSDVAVAPDGSVFVADWYDPGVGGHNMQDKDPTDKGDPKDYHHLRGRIYRIAPPGFKPVAPKLDLSNDAGQIAALESPNFATRYLAWTKLHTGGADTLTALTKVFKEDKNPRFRARALWLLARSTEGKAHVATALKDADPDIRITGIRAARLIKMDMVDVAKDLAADDNMAVNREVALAMNYEPADRAVPVLVKLADKYDGKDRWYLEALGIGATGKEEQVLVAWTKDHKNNDPKVAELLTWRLKKDGSGTASTVSGKQASIQEWRAIGPFDGSNGDAALDTTFGPEKAPGVIDLQASYKGLGEKTLHWAAYKTNAEAEGQPAIDFNKFCVERGARSDGTVGFFAVGLVATKEQRATLKLGSDDGVKVWFNGKVVHEFKGTRAVAPEDDVAPLELHQGMNVLLCKLQNGDGASGLAASITTDPPVKMTLELPAAGANAAPAAGGVGAAAPEPPALLSKDGKPLGSPDQLATLPGDPKAGPAVFADPNGANCVRCHQISDRGGEFGPPLTTIGQKLSKSQILESILYPSNAILMGFEGWVVQTKDGDVFDGLLVTENDDQITLKDVEGKYHDIPKANLAAKKQMKESMMPPGLNGMMTRQQLLDLVAYLSTLRNPE